MNIAIGQLNIKPEEIHYHSQQIQEIIRQGNASNIDLLIFPAFSTTGYLPKDTTLFPDFYEDCRAINGQITAQAKNMAILWGGITDKQEQVTPTIFLAKNQHIIFSATPCQRENNRYDLTINGKTISLLFSWDNPNNPNHQAINGNQLELMFYTNPWKELAAADEVTPSNRPTLHLHHAGLAYEGKQIFVLPGSSRYTTAGNQEVRATPFGKTGLFPLDMLPPTAHEEQEESAAIYQKTVYGIRSFMKNSGLQKVVIGLSGGIDSALNACLYQQAIGAENVFLVNMPSRYNAQLTQDLARNLSEKLGCPYGVFPIEESVKATVRQLETTPFSWQGKKQTLAVSGFTAENIQARDRGGRLLAAIAQSVSGVFTANCNKTEIAVGYATMYGDQAGFLAATGNLWKHEVYALAQYMDQFIYGESVLAEIIKLKPSAELSPQQDITKGLGDPLIYEYHDKLLAAWEDRETPLTLIEILRLYEQKTLGDAIGCPQALIDSHFSNADQFIADLEKWWRAYEGMANVKRLQSPPILIVHNPPRHEHRHRLHTPYFSLDYLKKKADLLQ